MARSPVSGAARDAGVWVKGEIVTQLKLALQSGAYISETPSTPEASAKIRKGNYERLFDEAKRRVRAWESANVPKR